jgi:hypothetical protein
MIEMAVTCRGCGEEAKLAYGLCGKCRLVSPRKRPLNPRYTGATRRRGSTSVDVGARKFLVCGCDYMLATLEVEPHSALDCPNAKVVIIARGHDEGGKGR